MNSNDIRVKKTKKALQVALATLMSEKDIRKITVGELVERADIHRATFYTHYSDIYELYDGIENQIISEIAAVIREEPDHDYTHAYQAIINQLLSNREIGQMMFGEHVSASFHGRLTAVMEERYLQIWLYEGRVREVNEQTRFMVTYHINGCIAIIERWVKNGYRESGDEIFELLRIANGIIDEKLDGKDCGK